MLGSAGAPTRARLALRALASLAASIVVTSAALGLAADALVAKDQIVRTIVERGKRYELIWGHTEWSWNRREFFVAVHGTGDTTGDYLAAIYEGIGEKFKLLKQIRSRSSSFSAPRFFWATVDGSNSRQHLVDITELAYGTGNFRTEHIFLFRSDGGIETVEFVAAPKSWMPQLRAGEGVWKGEQNRFSDTALSSRSTYGRTAIETVVRRPERSPEPTRWRKRTGNTALSRRPSSAGPSIRT